MSQSLRSVRVRSMVPHLIGIVFGCLWGTIAAQVLPAGYRSAGLALVVVLGVLFVLRMRRRAASVSASASASGSSAAQGRPLFRSRAYLVAVLMEVAAIYGASAWFAHFGGMEYFLSTVGIVVGLHFIGLWKATGGSRFLRISAAMCLVSGVSLLVPLMWHALHARELLLGVGNALVLWVGASGSGEQVG